MQADNRIGTVVIYRRTVGVLVEDGQTIQRGFFARDYVSPNNKEQRTKRTPQSGDRIIFKLDPAREVGYEVYMWAFEDEFPSTE